jgi:hypothetical protein
MAEQRNSMPTAENAAPRPTVLVDAGAEGRVMLADSLSFEFRRAQ